LVRRRLARRPPVVMANTPERHPIFRGRLLVPPALLNPIASLLLNGNPAFMHTGFVLRVTKTEPIFVNKHCLRSWIDGFPSSPFNRPSGYSLPLVSNLPPKPKSWIVTG